MTCSFFVVLCEDLWKKEQAGGKLEGEKECEFEGEKEVTMEEKRQKLKVELVKKGAAKMIAKSYIPTQICERNALFF